MHINVERLAVAVDRDVRGGVGGGDGVEHLATDSVHTHHGDPGLGGRVIGVSRARDRDPVRDTLGNYYNINTLILILSTTILTEVPTMLPRVGEPPVTENAWGGVLPASGQAVY